MGCTEVGSARERVLRTALAAAPLIILVSGGFEKSAKNDNDTDNDDDNDNDNHQRGTPAAQQQPAQPAQHSSSAAQQQQQRSGSAAQQRPQPCI